jgi:predicted phage terminase large subunit-like protein
MAQARKALRNITNEFTNNPFINARIIKILKNTADVFEVVLDSGGRDTTVLIEVYGKGASIRGLNNKDVRPSLILIDDVQDSADLLSEVVPEQDWDWFLSDVMFLAQSARIFMIGNNLGEKCIIERVARNAESMGFKFKRIPCADPEFTVSTWPEKQSIDEIKKERADYEAIGKLDVWLREKMCMATSEETRLFKDEMYRHYPSSLKDRIAREGEVLAALDPASSARHDSCFRAIVVGALMPDGHWYVLSTLYGRWDSIQLLDKIFEAVRKWGIREFGIEKGQYQQILEPILYREMTLRRCRFNITPLEHGKIGSKLERIKMLQPYFKSGAVWFPEADDWLTEMKNELAGVTRDELKSEYVDLCFAAGTKVATKFGDKNIEDMKIGDIVITPFGYRKVTGARCTGKSEVVERFGLRATKDHKIYINNIGLVSIGDLCENASISKLTFMEVWLWRLKKLLCLMEGVTISEQRESIISVQEQSITKPLTRRYTEILGNFITKRKFLAVFTFIISTATLSIMTLVTLIVYKLSNIINRLRELIKSGKRSILNQLDQWLRSGIVAKMAENGIKNTLKVSGFIQRNISAFVYNVGKLLNLSNGHLNYVLRCVQIVTPYYEMERSEYVRFVPSPIIPQGQEIKKRVASNVLGFQEKIKESVFNITVDGEGVYYANGVLVSNCDALAMLVTQMRAFSSRTEVTDSKKRYNFGKNPEYAFNPMTV